MFLMLSRAESITAALKQTAAPPSPASASASPTGGRMAIDPAVERSAQRGICEMDLITQESWGTACASRRAPASWTEVTTLLWAKVDSFSHTTLRFCCGCHAGDPVRGADAVKRLAAAWRRGHRQGDVRMEDQTPTRQSKARLRFCFSSQSFHHIQPVRNTSTQTVWAPPVIKRNV